MQKLFKSITHRNAKGVLVKKQWAIQLDKLICKIKKQCWMCGDSVLYNSTRQMCQYCERETFGD